MKPLGVHYLIELAGCPAHLLNDLDHVRGTLLDAARTAKATVINDSFNLFNPHGISGFVVIAESHLSIHTWPERNYAAVDIFTCGHFDLTEIAMNEIVQAFQPEKYFTYKAFRGIFQGESKELLSAHSEEGENCKLLPVFASHVYEPDGLKSTYSCM